MAEAHWTKTLPGAGNADERHSGGRPQSAAQRAHNRRFRAALMVTTALAATSLDMSANAQTLWTGAISSDWTEPGNWSAGVPGPADFAAIDTLTPSTVLGAAGFAHTLYVGDAGFGFLEIENGGLLTTAFGTIGSGSDGAVHVTGTNAQWQNSAALVVGTNGNGSLTVEAGGTVTSDSGAIGGNFASHSGTGTVTVSGTSSSWHNTFGLYVGVGSGSGTLTIEDGGAVSSQTGIIGRFADSNGAATVTGQGSAWTNSSYIVAGYEGVGALTVGAGGTVFSDDGFIGFASGSSGTVSVVGANALWDNSGFLHVGENGNGTLTITHGGTVSNTEGSVGFGDGTGTVTVSGTGSSWDNSGFLFVGRDGTGTLTIDDGGAVTNSFGYIGAKLGSSGAVTVVGTGSSWQNSGNLYVASGGAGVLTIEAGAAVSNVTGFIGFSAGSNGAATVSNAAWHNSHDFYIGREGTGSLLIDDGGAVTSVDGLIGFYEGSNGAVAVSGTGTTWQNSGDLSIGREGIGVLTVADGGAVSAQQISIADQASGAGTLNIGAAAGDAAVAAGTLDTGTIAFGDGTGALVFNHTATDYLFNPALSGVGSLSHLAGTTIMTGNSATFTGATTVHAGTLVVNGALGGTLGGTLDVLAGGRLEGTGSVATTTIASGGTVAPGNSIGTLNVVGDITFDAGSIYEVEVDPAGSDSDLVHATGTATLNGGSVAHIGLAGAYQPFATYTILTADGGVAGTFGDVSSAFAFLDPTLSYDPNNVFLKLVRNDIAFCGVGLTFNQCATGEGAESLGFGNPLHDALVVLDADTARTAFDGLSGEIHGSAKTVMLEDSRFVREAATARVRAAFAGGAAPADTGGLAAWGHAFGSWSEWDSDGNAASLERSVAGFIAGGDGMVGENFRLGLLAGYSRTSFDVDGRSSSGSSDNVHLGVYGGSQWGNLGLRAGAAYTWHDVETSRQVAFPGFTDTLSADYDAATAQVFGELGYRIDTVAASFEPFANLAYVNVRTDGFAETGGAAALSGASSNTDATFTTLGLRASTGFMLGTVNVTARGMLGWRHAFGDVTPLSTHAFTGGDAFTIAGVPVAKDAAIIQAGLDLAISPTAILGIAYDAQITSRARDHGLKADFTMKF